MNEFWKNTTEKEEWHFVKKRGELMFTISKVLSKLLTKKSKLGFMDDVTSWLEVL